MNKTSILVLAVAGVLAFTSGCAHLMGKGNDLEAIQQVLPPG
jgi:hypothetical protein